MNISFKIVELLKKNLFLIFTLLCANSSFAQSESNLKFMGVELKGTLQEFSTIFEEMHPNFLSYEKSDTAYRYKGDFYKFKDCKISIHARKKYYNIVTCGSVLIDNTNLYSNELKDLFNSLNNKYGHYMVEKRDGNNYFKIRWTTDNGLIEFELFNLGAYFGTISYIDKFEAIDIIKKEFESEKKLNDDL